MPSRPPAVDRAPELTLAAEREHLADSRAALRRMREHTGSLTAFGADHVSTEHLKQALYRRMQALEDDPSVPLFFGRLDYDSALGAEADETLYIGRRHVASEAGGEPMVIDWRAGMSPALLSRPARRSDDGAATPTLRILRRPSHRLRGRRPDPAHARPAGRRVGDPGVRDRAAADRADARHRRHHPTRAGRHRPHRAEPVGLHPGRTRHGEDCGRAAPGGVPAVRLPRAAVPLRACWWSARTTASCPTSATCCPRSARSTPRKPR